MKRLNDYWLVPLLIFLAVMVVSAYSSVAHAVGDVYDPLVKPDGFIVCNLPVTRTDGTALSAGEVAKVNFYQSADGKTWTPAGSAAECRMAVNIAGLNDGQYYYAADAVDKGGRASAISKSFPFVVRRVYPPTVPTDLRME